VATMEELKQKASELDIEGRSSMNKEELEAAVAEAEGSGDTGTDTGTAGPAMSASAIESSLDAWWAAQIASGARAEDLEDALATFEPKGPVGMIEEKTENQYGHYSVAVTASQA
jgi:hypothetical protein